MVHSWKKLGTTSDEGSENNADMFALFGGWWLVVDETAFVLCGFVQQTLDMRY